MEAIKILAAFAAGLGCGVLATRSYFKTRYESFANEEIESVIENFKKKIDEDVKKMEENREKEYSKVVDSYISPVPPSKIVKDEEEHPEDDIPDEPYQITSMEYMDDGDYDKKVATYYVDDEALVVDTDDVSEDGELADVGRTIGKDNIEILLAGFDDGSALYVRNPSLGVDYEVSKSYASYSEIIGS